MMYLEKVYQNNNFVDGLPVYIYYNDIDRRYHADLDCANPMGTLGVFNEIEVQNEIYILTMIDTFCRLCHESYKMVGE